MMMLGRIALLALVASVAQIATACYEPPEPDCGFGCGPNDACPDDYTCTGDGYCHRNGTSPSLVCSTATIPFNVESVTSTGNTQLTVIFEAIPTVDQAQNLANYTIAATTGGSSNNLTIDRIDVEGMTVILGTSAQSAIDYTLIVSGITRASDSAPLVGDTGAFTGRTAFDVIGAAAITAEMMTVTFDAPPDPIAAINPQNYTVDNAVVAGVALAGDVVTLQLAPNFGGASFVRVDQVARASDLEPLTVDSATFTAIQPFNVFAAASVSNTSIAVEFDAPPNPVAATTLANYSIDGLTLAGTPTLIDNVVTIMTSPQQAFDYRLVVSGVTRATDGEHLFNTSVLFGDSSLVPVVTNAVVESTSPDNGTTPYNTGTTTVQITGTNLISVSCPAGVTLGDFAAPAGTDTQATECSVDSDSQITATFPAGIATRGSTGWSLTISNQVGTTTSTPLFAPRAGLLVSEIYPGTAGADDHEFIELYNPTDTNIGLTFHHLHLHVLDATGFDTDEPLTMINTVVPAHGFYLIASDASDTGDAWYAHRDATYPGGLVANGGVYISSSASPNAFEFDRVGWGTQSALGFEGSAAADIPAGDSIQRLPAGGAGDATDTDDNAADFTAPSPTITPLGTVDPPQP